MSGGCAVMSGGFSVDVRRMCCGCPVGYRWMVGGFAVYDSWMFAQVFRGPTGGTYPHPPCVGAYLIISRLWEPRQLEILHAMGLAAGSGDACGDRRM